MEEVNGNEAAHVNDKPHVNPTRDLETTLTPEVHSSSKFEQDVIHDPFPGSDVATIVTVNPHQLWLMFSECEGAKEMREGIAILAKQFKFLNGPQGPQIFNVFEKLVQDWASVLEELTRAEGKFARDKELPGNPRILISAGMAAIKKYRKVAARYKALSAMAITLEGIFAKAEAFDKWIRDDHKTIGCAAPEAKVESHVCAEDKNRKLSNYPLHVQQLKILEEVLTRVEAMTEMINEKLAEVGVN